MEIYQDFVQIRRFAEIVEAKLFKQKKEANNSQYARPRRPNITPYYKSVKEGRIRIQLEI